MQLSNNYSGDFFSNLKVIGFDFDNTLVDEQYNILNRWKKTLSHFKYLSPHLYNTFLEVYSLTGPSYNHHINDVLSSLDINSKYTYNIMNRFRKCSEPEKIFPSVKAALNFLSSKNLTIGIITNGKKAYQEPRIKSSGLFNHINFIYYGDKENKTDKEIFKKCMKRFNVVNPKQFLFVGDDYLFDIDNVISLGAKAIWIDSHRKSYKKNDLLLTFDNFSNFYKRMRKSMI